MVELVIALIVLTVGLLGMAGTTAWVVRQSTLAQMTSKRTAAVESVVERLRATPYDDLAAGADTLAGYHLSWTVSSSTRSTEITIFSRGPGLDGRSGGFPHLSSSVRDSLVYLVGRP